MKCPVCKKNIPEQSLRCPYCKARTGVICSRCNTVNPIGTVVCKKCNKELLKICKHCNSVNFPNAIKCRKCGSAFGAAEEKTEKSEDIRLEYIPKFFTGTQALNSITEGLRSGNKKLISISGEKGIGKSFLLRNVIESMKNDNLQWCAGRCTPLTQVTPGGVIQDMLLNYFKLPNFCTNNEEIQKDACSFFSKNFRFLSTDEVSDFFNFLYNFKEGNYEDIIINKKRIYSILNKIFETFTGSGKFVFVIDNFDFIDGFSAEFLNKFIQKEYNWKNLRLITIYNTRKPVSSFFALDTKDLELLLDINLAPLTPEELENCIKPEQAPYITAREKEIIIQKSKGNPAFAQQAVSYSFDCQMSDSAFLLPDNFKDLVQKRLASLKKNNLNAYKLLSGAAILGDKLNLLLLKEVFGYHNQEFNELMQYLVKTDFVRKYNDIYYEFDNLLLWETVLKNIPKNSVYQDINVKIGKALSVFTLNANASMALIAHNLRENRMAFNIWTKITRLAAYVGDINLYVISQKQCLALINEFNENETLDIRYSISEKLGKLLAEYDPEGAKEFLPDAVAHAKDSNNEVKEIELLGYLAQCCLKTGNYFGNIECIDNALKKLKPSQELEAALMKAEKLPALLYIGNCGEIVNLCDNEILPKLNSFMQKPKLSNSIPLEFVSTTVVHVNLILAKALAVQGNDRANDVLKKISEITDKQKIKSPLFMCKILLTQAFAAIISGDFAQSLSILEDTDRKYRTSIMDTESISYWNLIYLTNKFLLKDYDGIREELFDAVTYANNTSDSFTKNILKVYLGKIFKDDNKAKHALKIYDEQVSYFAKEKISAGALLCWYLIAEATIIAENPRNAIDIANQALEIAQNPKINNYFFIVKLKIVLALAYIELADYETAKINIESALKLAKKYNMNDLLSRVYILYGSYLQDIGTRNSQNQTEYLKTALKMYDKAIELTQKTKNSYINKYALDKKQILSSYCITNNIIL